MAEPTDSNEAKYESDANTNIYYIDQDKLENHIEISRNQTVSYYVEHCHKILRYHQNLNVSAKGNATGIACALCQLLEKRKIAKIASISTGMDVAELLTSYQSTDVEPTPMMTFHLKRGEIGQYIIQSQQERIIDVFEIYDTDISGYLSFDIIETLKLSEIFKSNESQIEHSEAFLSAFEKEKKLDLPNFIKYASILIHPLLKDKIFHGALFTEFDVY